MSCSICYDAVYVAGVTGRGLLSNCVSQITDHANETHLGPDIRPALVLPCRHHFLGLPCMSNISYRPARRPPLDVFRLQARHTCTRYHYGLHGIVLPSPNALLSAACLGCCEANLRLVKTSAYDNIRTARVCLERANTVDKPGPPPHGTRNVSQAVADLITKVCATQTQIQQVVTILAPRGLERNSLESG